MGLMSQKDLAQQGARRINEFQAETERNKAQAARDEEDRIFAQNHPDPTKEGEGLGDPMAMFTPIAGDIVDVGRAIGSAAQGDWSGAALSMVAAVPFVGDGLKAGLKSMKKIKGQAGSATTQVATTAGSYKKAVAKALEINPKGKTVLDYGAGLGLGTDAMRETSKMKVTSYEPFPERWKGDKPVDYTDSTKINTKFDTVVNLNVLNVLEPELRAVVAKDLMSKVKEGGVAIVGTRGWKGDVNAAKKATAAPEDKALWIHKSSGDVYQKGFDGDELKDYMAGLAPEGYRVEKGKGIANQTVYIHNDNKPKATRPKSNRDYPNTPLDASLNQRKQVEFLENQGYKLWDGAGPKDFTYDYADNNNIVIHYLRTSDAPDGGVVKEIMSPEVSPTATLKQLRKGMGYAEGGLVDEMDSVDDFTLDGGLPKAAAPYEGDRAALDAAVIEMRRIEADGPNPTFYAKDDQDFDVYSTPSVAITQTEEMLTQEPVQSGALLDETGMSNREPMVPIDETGMDSREAAYVKPAMTQDKTRILNTLDALGPLEGLDHGVNGKLVNGRLTYDYGVEEATLEDMDIDRNAAKYKAADGTIDAKAVATDVAVKFHSTLKSKIPNWDKLPTEVYDAVFSLAWNSGRVKFKGYSLGTNLNKIAASKDTEAVKKAAYAAELKKNLLDVVGAKIKDEDGNSLRKVQRGLANRRGRDYNLAADYLGVDKLTHYKVTRVLNEAKKDVGSKVEYYTEGSDTAVRTLNLTRTMLEKEQGKSGTKTPIG